MSAPTRARAVVSDFGGVLTTPLMAAYARVHEHYGIPAHAVGDALRRLEARDGESPLFALERGERSEAAFVAALEAEVGELLGRPVALPGYGPRFLDELRPNEALIAHYRELRARGVRLALLTNNVREWEALWRAKLPVDELFEVVVDSAFVGMRKPEPRIYTLTLERFGVPAGDCVFVDDVEVNVQAAEAAGMRGVLFRETAGAIAALDALLWS